MRRARTDHDRLRRIDAVSSREGEWETWQRRATPPGPRVARAGAQARPIRARSSSVRLSFAALAADRVASGVRAPGIATTFSPSPRSQESTTSASVTSCARASSTSRSSRASRRTRRGPPSGECAITAIPRSAQRSRTPPRRARSSKGLIPTSTAAIGACSSASSSWARLTLHTPTRATSPSSTSRARARIDVRHGVRGSGA